MTIMLLTSYWQLFPGMFLYLLAVLCVIGFILSLPFIIYGAIKHKKNFIIGNYWLLLLLPIAVALYSLSFFLMFAIWDNDKYVIILTKQAIVFEANSAL